MYHIHSPTLAPQRARASTLLATKGMARLSELMAAGVTAATVSRLEREGAVVRIARGLYQLPDAPLHTHQALAEIAKLVPTGVICLTSALAFYELTDQIPAKVWVAIGPKDWRPRLQHPPTRFVHVTKSSHEADIGYHQINGVEVPIFGVAKTIADLFRHRRLVGLNVAIDGLRAALRTKQATPAEVAKRASDARVWKLMEPYVTALTSDG